MNSADLINESREKFELLSHHGYDRRSFLCGYLEGRVKNLSELKKAKDLLQGSWYFLMDLALEWKMGNSYCRVSEQDLQNLQSLIDKINEQE
jgi:hypothetical protein